VEDQFNNDTYKVRYRISTSITVNQSLQ